MAAKENAALTTTDEVQSEIELFEIDEPEDTLSETTRVATRIALTKLSGTETPKQIEAVILAYTREAFRARNALADKNDKWPLPKRLTPAQIAAAMAKTHNICRIAMADASTSSDYDLLAMYMADGPEKGTYITDDDPFRKAASEIDYELTTNDFKEVMFSLRNITERKQRTYDPDLICLNNGVFDYKTKTLMEHSPDFVFLSKSHVDYDENAENVHIENPDGTDWDIETWMEGLSDDPQITTALWQILSALVRPNVRWNRSAWLYSETGNNGKGTFCELARNMIGESSCASIPLADFGKDFYLEPLMHSNAIIVDENDVGTFIDRPGNLKAVTTGDVITINRKYKAPVTYRFRGFMVQCLNELPRIKDRSDSFYRRQLFIPMNKCFTGATRDYIKTDYLHRPEVLRYALKKVLEGSFYEIIEPDASRSIMEQYKEFNDPTRQFWFDVVCRARWDFLTYSFLYAAYKAWYSNNVPGGTPLGERKFQLEIANIAKSSGQWEITPPHKKMHVPAGAMSLPEPIILELNLKDFFSKSYHGADESRICTMDSQPSVARGLRRIKNDASPVEIAFQDVTSEEGE